MPPLPRGERSGGPVLRDVLAGAAAGGDRGGRRRGAAATRGRTPRAPRPAGRTSRPADRAPRPADRPAGAPDRARAPGHPDRSDRARADRGPPAPDPVGPGTGVAGAGGRVGDGHRLGIRGVGGPGRPRAAPRLRRGAPLRGRPRGGGRGARRLALLLRVPRGRGGGRGARRLRPARRDPPPRLRSLLPVRDRDALGDRARPVPPLQGGAGPRRTGREAVRGPGWSTA